MKTTTLSLIINLFIILTLPAIPIISFFTNSSPQAAENDSTAIQNKDNYNYPATPEKSGDDQTPILKQKNHENNYDSDKNLKQREHDERKKKRKTEPYV
jgi:hypothetical protein